MNMRRMRRNALFALYAGVTIATAPAAAVLPPSVAHAEETWQRPPLTIVSANLTIDGQPAVVPAANDQGTTYIGLRSLNERLGLATDWDADQRKATVSGRGRTLVLDPDSGSYTMNGQTSYGSPAVLQEGSIYVPLRFLLERMGYGISYDPVTRLIGIETIRENELAVQTATIEETGDGRSLAIHYPQLSGYANPDVQSAVNAFLKQEAEDQAKWGKEELAKAADALKEMPAGDGETKPEVSYGGAYTVTYNEKGLLSLYVDYHLYTGGAHGITFRKPYTFDLATGRTLSLKEATGGAADYVPIINDVIRTHLRETDLALLTPFETIEPDRPFFLKHNGVVVYFDLYEYAPYAAGMPEFEIPFDAFAKTG
ncbi:stalk domain-containing protein [Paenibacillus sp. GYB003]|uniref:stalk domain-containing protein n=1 Tax=Paenibacillus sp. GYB003 TaxID=2994392 RepID=UPI002F964E4B